MQNLHGILLSPRPNTSLNLERILRASLPARPSRLALSRAFASGRSIACIDTRRVDPSGGANDSFTLAIAHKEGQTSVLDVIRERRAPFSPESVVEEFCAVLRQYQIYCVYGDRYAGEWSIEAFRKRGVIYEHSEHSKSQLYQDALPLINSRTAALLDNTTLRRQLVMLERKTTRGGKDSIDHSPGAKDDVANAVCGALIYAGKSLGDPA